jgi:UDP-2,4-diacetamido-2,4,6-trideoxy-beta-L-altropyranose hydrolase
MKLLIVSEGGAAIGHGHLARCLALAQAFAEAGHEAEFAVAGDESARTLLGHRPVDFFDWQRCPERLLKRLNGFDVALVDSYLASADLLREVSARVRAAVFLDDFRRLDYPPGIVVNWSVSAASLGYPPGAGVGYLLGPEYVALRRAFWHIEPRPVRAEVGEVLVTFGGDDGRRLTPPALRLLAARFPHWDKTVVVGGACRCLDEIAAAADPRTRLLRAPGEAEMARAMYGADLAVSSGGQTLFELARIGLPGAVTAVADNQRRNVADWVSAGTIETLGDWDDPGWTERLGETLERLRDPGRRETAAEAGRRRVPGNGGGRIVRAVEERLTA